VYEELSKCKTLIKPLINEIHEGNLCVVESSDYSHLQKKYPKLGAGELSVITAAGDRIAFIEDRDAETAAREEGLKVYNIPEVLLACKRKGLIEKAEIAQIISELGEKDGYIFKKEIEEELTR
jgi:predicted nucleic acid-binding protein